MIFNLSEEVFSFASVVITRRVMFRRRRIVTRSIQGQKPFIRPEILPKNSPAAKHHAERDDYTASEKTILSRSSRQRTLSSEGTTRSAPASRRTAGS